MKLYYQAAGDDEAAARASIHGMLEASDWQVREHPAVKPLLSEVALLRATLAAEQGKEGLPGWEWSDVNWTAGDVRDGPYLFVGSPHIWGDPWTWTVTKPCNCPEHRSYDWPKVAEGTAPTAYEAMLAAEAAERGAR